MNYSVHDDFTNSKCASKIFFFPVKFDDAAMNPGILLPSNDIPMHHFFSEFYGLHLLAA